ncbi:electron transfer flavoprotein-ubiquinone oxidoreductase [Variovorax ginsengisoli]|uniref:Electron transfer flavoprotein-ubiquinone oxidoreductase n=1 Tax=Variovorax ginsengisoli TaxID=363844 RepID=A0ABT8SAG1_9BURK|nr:electron transfer flavoprotein-ubiquinone oxidoreductase [Variovorax ginsengisoli]MDN8616623.1 electron transfer flavoprotein-ubiquinone oxidoreductase [Variovorax ginsengisoli]MDO1535793.1 electron transfer flavoprotein-ubiquinone oxidoreductase [Variovorax ginsengisoli]
MKTPTQLLESHGPRDSMDFEVVIVGAGPAGLATAIRLKQIDSDISVVVLEKGSEPGAHILSGAVMDPRAIHELCPDWQQRGAPLRQPVTRDQLLVLSRTSFVSTPQWLMPRNFQNQGCYVISLGSVVRWLAQQAEDLGVEVFSGFAASELLCDDQNRVVGVATNHVGIGKDGQPTEQFQLGMELRGKYTVFAEGARGHLGKELIEKYRLADGKDCQSFAIGLKELWEVDPAKAEPGLVVHTAGWPMNPDTFGGGFLYHLEDNKLTLGMVVGLDYQNPFMSPFDEMQRWKTHPAIRTHLRGAKRIGYGARAINNGTPQALPKTIFPGGALVGCDAGYLNAARIKGSHAAIKSGMLCADAIADALSAGRAHDELAAYPAAFEASWLAAELKQARNFKLWHKKGDLVGKLMTGVEQWLLPKIGVSSPPWTLHNRSPDHASLRPADQCVVIDYPKPDGAISFDKLSSVFISNTNHEENQPAHLLIKNAAIPVSVNLAKFTGPETRYCPAGVYEFTRDPHGADQFVINAQNCVHCKTCDIKDPTQNIIWSSPEGGGGPNYTAM